MELLEQVKILLGIQPGDDREPLVQLLLENAKAYAAGVCHLPAYDPALDAAVLRMVEEDYNRRQSEGILSRGYSGLSESAAEDYSPQVMNLLRPHRRLRTL